MTTEMLEASMSAASAPPYVEDRLASELPSPPQTLQIPERLLDELADIIADALVASIERDRTLVTADR